MTDEEKKLAELEEIDMARFKAYTKDLEDGTVGLTNMAVAVLD